VVMQVGVSKGRTSCIKAFLRDAGLSTDLKKFNIRLDSSTAGEDQRSCLDPATRPYSLEDWLRAQRPLKIYPGAPSRDSPVRHKDQCATLDLLPVS